MKRKLNNQNGVSMILALVVSLVVTCACASLFAAVSAMIKSAGNEMNQERARILAMSLSEVIKDEFLNVEVVTEGEGEEASISYRYKDGYGENFASSIPAYVYKNLGTPSWQWYNEDESFRTKTAATRTFDFGRIAGEEGKSPAEIKVSIYWKSEGGNELRQIFTERELYVTCTATVDRQESNVTYKYNYSDDYRVAGGYLWLTPVLVS